MLSTAIRIATVNEAFELPEWRTMTVSPMRTSAIVLSSTLTGCWRRRTTVELAAKHVSPAQHGQILLRGRASGAHTSGPKE